MPIGVQRKFLAQAVPELTATVPWRSPCTAPHDKNSAYHYCRFQEVAVAEQALSNYIEVYYNRRGKHSTNDYTSPAHQELEWWNNRKVLNHDSTKLWQDQKKTMAQADKNRKIMQKIVIGCGIVLGIIAFSYFDVGQYLSLEYFKASQAKFQALYLENRFPVISAYMALYIVVTALSIPGAAVMTLAGGGLFGFILGTVAVSFASTIGATLASAVSRFLLRDWVQNRFSNRLEKINNGIEKGGAFSRSR